MSVDLLIDVRWLLARQTEILPTDPGVDDYSALAAAVARHRVNTPRLGEHADAAWRAAALLHTIVQLKPLPSRNALFACGIAVAYMHASNEGIDPPYGALIELVKDLQSTDATVYGAAELIRSWRI
ncbi:toxin Doc [Streptomyces sp. WAC 00631]|nr:MULTISPECIES: toxin Doc [unclassified Streptomyces]MCC5037209.1 toxin Doc [Streptomyces sp. WAC 00631]MCC9737811.1 toxin Doc [Streptomyces sp. MNU89]